MRKIFLFTLIFWVYLVFSTVRLCHAQETGAGIASYVPIPGADVVAGKVVSFGQNGYFLSSAESDAAMFGVVSDSAPVSLKAGFTGQNNLHRVITLGKAVVVVSANNGEIKPGDPVTSSAQSGVAQKASQYGYVLGMAMEGFKGAGTGKIVVSINIRPNLQVNTLKVNLLEALKMGVSAPFMSPVVSLRYIVAALVVLFSFAFGFLFFGRSTAKGIEALGRNPMAAKVIGASMVFNLLLTLGVVLVGLGLAYLILTL